MIGGIDTGSVIEDDDPDADNLLEATGSMTIVDPDVGESWCYQESVAGSAMKRWKDHSGRSCADAQL